MSSGGSGYGGYVAGGGDVLGSAITSGVSIAAADRAWRRQKKVLQNQIQWRVADLRAAGLNPILAAGSPIGGGAPSVAMPNIPDFGKSLSRGAEAMASTAQKRSQASTFKQQGEAFRTAAALNTEKIGTERQHQAALSMAAERDAANADSIRLQMELYKARLPEMQAIADMWTDPVMRRMMQAKHLFSGFRVLGSGVSRDQGWRPNPPRPQEGGPRPQRPVRPNRR